MIENTLKKFDLSEKEVSAYLTLLKYGMQTATLLAKRMEISRGTAFFLSKNLVQKGLATKSEKAGTQYFSAVDPAYLNSLVLRKKEEVYTLEEDLQNVVPILQALKNPLSPLPKIQFFEGKEGLKTLLEETLTTKSKKLKGILSMEDLYKVYGETYFESYIKRRIKAGIELKVLRNKTKDIKDIWKSGKNVMREVKYLPKNMSFPSTIYLYDNKVIFISSEKEGFGVLIESEEYHKMQDSLFNVVWSTSSA